PTGPLAYQEYQQFTCVVRNGRSSNKGYEQKYPSTYAILKHFTTMRAFWTACDVLVDRTHEDWTPEEDWYITESVGIIPRDEVARFMLRTAPAIKRRLYDIGINSRNRWGWTLSHAAAMLGVKNHVLTRYVEHGLLPIFRGNKCIYLDPGDLLVVQEYNWQRKRHRRELDRAVRRSLVQRVCHIMLGHDWRSTSTFQPHPKV